MMPTEGKTVTFTAVPGVPLIEPGDDLCAALVDCVRHAGIVPQDHDVFVIAQKIVSKAEGRYVDLNDIVPSARAKELAAAVSNDPQIVEVILSETEQVVRYGHGVLVVAHRLGFVMANAGVDQSDGTDGCRPAVGACAQPRVECTCMQRGRSAATAGA